MEVACPSRGLKWHQAGAQGAILLRGTFNRTHDVRLQYEAGRVLRLTAAAGLVLSHGHVEGYRRQRARAGLSRPSTDDAPAVALWTGPSERAVRADGASL